jgi:hypothetical protein
VLLFQALEVAELFAIFLFSQNKKHKTYLGPVLLFCRRKQQLIYPDLKIQNQDSKFNDKNFSFSGLTI